MRAFGVSYRCVNKVFALLVYVYVVLSRPPMKITCLQIAYV